MSISVLIALGIVAAALTELYIRRDSSRRPLADQFHGPEAKKPLGIEATDPELVEAAAEDNRATLHRTSDMGEGGWRTIRPRRIKDEQAYARSWVSELKKD